jgi:hypothetical protein
VEGEVVTLEGVLARMLAGWRPARTWGEREDGEDARPLWSDPDAVEEFYGSPRDLVAGQLGTEGREGGVLTTPEGRALAALEEAAIEWRRIYSVHGRKRPLSEDEDLEDAIDRYLSLREGA